MASNTTSNASNPRVSPSQSPPHEPQSPRPEENVENKVETITALAETLFATFKMEEKYSKVSTLIFERRHPTLSPVDLDWLFPEAIPLKERTIKVKNNKWIFFAPPSHAESLTKYHRTNLAMFAEKLQAQVSIASEPILDTIPIVIEGFPRHTTDEDIETILFDS